MTAVFGFFVTMFRGLWSTLNSIAFDDFFGYSVSFGAIITALLIVSMVVSIFWKGAKG